MMILDFVSSPNRSSFMCAFCILALPGRSRRPVFFTPTFEGPIQWRRRGCVFAIFQFRFSNFQSAAPCGDSCFSHESTVTNHLSLSALECAVPQFRALTLLECAVTKTPSSKSFRMRRSEKRWGGGRYNYCRVNNQVRPRVAATTKPKRRGAAEGNQTTGNITVS